MDLELETGFGMVMNYELESYDHCRCGEEFRIGIGLRVWFVFLD